MRSKITFLLCFNFVLSFAQPAQPVVGIIYELDSISDYFILEAPKNEQVVIADKYLFNEERYVLKQLHEVLEKKGFGVLKLTLPPELKPKVFVGSSGIVSSDFSDWMAKEKKEKNVSHVILLRHVKLPQEQIKDSPLDTYLSNEEFGVITYFKQPTEIVVYAMIDYKVFTTSDFKEIYYQPYQFGQKDWRKIIEHDTPLTDRGLILEASLPMVKSELETMFLNHIQKISTLIYHN